MSPIVTSIVAVIVGLVLIGIVWAVVSAVRSTTDASFLSAERAPEAQDRARPALTDFHVHDDTARIFYAVPLPDGNIDPHLRDLLCHDASLVLREKRDHGLPIAQVSKAEVYGRRGGEPVEVAVLELEDPGEIPEIAVPELVPHAAMEGYDPLAHLGEQEFDIRPGVAGTEPTSELRPFSEELEFAQSVESELRALGIDPYDASLTDLALSLLKIGGYAITPLSEDSYFAQKTGATSLLVVHEHRAGEHPELSEQAVNAFVIAVAQRNPQRALLVTDKFCPYIVYEKERSDPRCRFVTRERLQRFVDSFALQ